MATQSKLRFVMAGVFVIVLSACAPAAKSPYNDWLNTMPDHVPRADGEKNLKGLLGEKIYN